MLPTTLRTPLATSSRTPPAMQDKTLELSLRQYEPHASSGAANKSVSPYEMKR
jgi:hypothetical protein